MEDDLVTSFNKFHIKWDILVDRISEPVGNLNDVVTEHWVNVVGQKAEARKVFSKPDYLGEIPDGYNNKAIYSAKSREWHLNYIWVPLEHWLGGVSKRG